MIKPNYFAFVCDGCGRQHRFAEVGEPFPRGWLRTPREEHVYRRDEIVVACSADCADAAKRAVAQRIKDRAKREAERVMAQRLERGDGVSR